MVTKPQLLWILLWYFFLSMTEVNSSFLESISIQHFPHQRAQIPRILSIHFPWVWSPWIKASLSTSPPPPTPSLDSSASSCLQGNKRTRNTVQEVSEATAAVYVTADHTHRPELIFKVLLAAREDRKCSLTVCQWGKGNSWVNVYTVSVLGDLMIEDDGRQSWNDTYYTFKKKYSL